MYTTKITNKNILGKDLGYCTTGDPYKSGNKDMPKGSRHKGTQFKTNPPKNTCNGDNYFNKMSYQSAGPLQDKTSYLKAAPLDKRKLGFGTKNAPRRDEFASTVITEQYREALKCELRQEKSQLGAAIQVSDEQAALAAKPNPRKPVRHLYDVGRKQVTEFDQKSSRDCYYSNKGGERQLGNQQISSASVGDGAWTAPGDSEFKRVRKTKEFFDNSHLGC